MRLSGLVTAVSLAMAVGVSGVSASEANGAPDFQEIYGLIRAHVAGVSEAELNQAAVEGLLKELRSRVVLVPAGGQTNLPEQSNLVSEAKIFEDNLAYLRIGRVDAGLADAIRAAYKQLDATNKLQGVVLDLRYVEGTDYSAAVDAADLFIVGSQPLLDWGSGVAKSAGNRRMIALPLAVLVNHETTGAAEALAAVLREGKAGLIIGNTTGGGAMMFQTYPLKSGGELKIASAPVKLGDGRPLPLRGLKPDIRVPVRPEQEQVYYDDPFKVIATASQRAGAGNASTNSESGAFVPRVRMNEAELVREHRQETNLSTEIDRVPRRPAEPPRPVVQDPVLARALDLLRGLAIVRESRL